MGGDDDALRFDFMAVGDNRFRPVSFINVDDARFRGFSPVLSRMSADPQVFSTLKFAWSNCLIWGYPHHFYNLPRDADFAVDPGLRFHISLFLFPVGEKIAVHFPKIAFDPLVSDDFFDSLQAAEIVFIIEFRCFFAEGPEQFVKNEPMLDGDFRGRGSGGALVDPVFVHNHDLTRIGEGFVGCGKPRNAGADDQCIAI